MNGKSWKTSLGAIGLFLTGLTGAVAIVTGQVPLNMESVGALAATFSAGWAAWNSKDKNVTGAGKNAETVQQ